MSSCETQRLWRVCTYHWVKSTLHRSSFPVPLKQKTCIKYPDYPWTYLRNSGNVYNKNKNRRIKIDSFLDLCQQILSVDHLIYRIWIIVKRRHHSDVKLLWAKFIFLYQLGVFYFICIIFLHVINNLRINCCLGIILNFKLNPTRF